MPKVKKKKVRDPRNFKFKGLDGVGYVLTPKQKLWCDSFLEPGSNQTIASLEAYKVTNKHLCSIPWRLLSKNEERRRIAAENTAHGIGVQNLRKITISSYINKVLDDEGFTDDVVNLEHFKSIKQDKSLPAKNQAIDMYYKKRKKYAPTEVIIRNKLTKESLDRIIKD